MEQQQGTSAFALRSDSNSTRAYNPEPHQFFRLLEELRSKYQFLLEEHSALAQENIHLRKQDGLCHNHLQIELTDASKPPILYDFSAFPERDEEKEGEVTVEPIRGIPPIRVGGCKPSPRSLRRAVAGQEVKDHPSPMKATSGALQVKCRPLAPDVAIDMYTERESTGTSVDKSPKTTLVGAAEHRSRDSRSSAEKAWKAQMLMSYSKKLGSRGGSFDSILHLSSATSCDSRIREERLINFFSEAHDLKRGKTSKPHDLLHTLGHLVEDPNSSLQAYVWAKVMFISILVTVVVNVMQTIQPPPVEGNAVAVLEVVCDAVFLLEVMLRYCCCQNQWAFFTNPHNVIDLCGLCSMVARIVVSFILPDTNFTDDARYFLLCVVPILRGLKMLRRWEKFRLMFGCGLELVLDIMPSLIFLLFILAQVFGTMIYFAEYKENIGIASLPDALWFTIVTMATVGYGDIYPEGYWGKSITIVLVITSALYMAVPIGIVGSAFDQVWRNRDKLLLIQSVQQRLKAEGVGPADIPYLFGRMSGNMSGFLTLEVFQRMMVRLNLDVSEETRLDLFASFDGNDDGEISPKEFVRHFYPKAYISIYGTAELAEKAALATAEGARYTSALKTKAEEYAATNKEA